MNKQRLSGIVLITGFIVLALGGFIYSPLNLYQETDIEVRMQIVETHRSQFNTAQIASVVGVMGMAVGYLLLTLHLQGDRAAGFANLGAASILIGAIFLAIYNLQGISGPRAYLESASMESTARSIFAEGFTWLTIAGYLLYGITFLRGDFPRWLAITVLAVTILVLIVALFIETAAVELLFLMPLVVGIALLRRSKDD